jgi:dUTPase
LAGTLYSISLICISSSDYRSGKKISIETVNFSNTPFGISKKDNINIGRLINTELINTNRTPTDKYFPF